MTCRFCHRPLTHVFADLGMLPLSNAYVHPSRLREPETFYPLVAWVCDGCFLVQIAAVETPEHIFSNYAYFSSYSDAWLAHAREYAAEVRDRLALHAQSQVIEIASNDGYLLQYFEGMNRLGVEPAANVAENARARGIETWSLFFGTETARKIEGRADLLIANNVLAHVPDLNDFVEGLRIALAPQGTLTLEFPHLLRLIESTQFDTIYHEHFSYFSLTTVEKVLRAHGLRVVDVQEIATHGGSLRVFAQHDRGTDEARRSFVDERGLDDIRTYGRFTGDVQARKRALLRFLIESKENGKRVAGYGAPAKASTLLNYCGIGTDLIDYTVDRSPHKQGLFVPGVRIPIHPVEKLIETKPDLVLILPWNLRDEVIEQTAFVRDWGARFVIANPDVEVLV